MCTVATHAERGAPEQRLYRAIRHVVLRFECDGYEPTSFHELSRRVDCYKVHSCTAAPAGDEGVRLENGKYPTLSLFLSWNDGQL